MQLKKVETSKSEYNSISELINTTRYLYSTDYEDDGFITYLTASHQINKPIEIVRYKTYGGTVFVSKEITGGQINIYSDDLNCELKEVYRLRLSKPLLQENFKFSNSSIGILPDDSSPKQIFDKDIKYGKISEFQYDSYGNILTSSKKQNGIIAYEWSSEYNYFYPSTITASSSDQNLVRSFIYKPMVGLTQEIDINGKSKYYEYDAFNRLNYIKDDSGNILKRISYNHKIKEPKIKIFPNSLKFSALGETKFFKIETEGEWEIEEGFYNDWFTFSSKSGTGSAVIEISSPVNNIGLIYDNLVIRSGNEDVVLTLQQSSNMH